LAHLRKIYAIDAPRNGKLDRGYAFLRKALQEFDAATATLPRRHRAPTHEIIDALYRAEDQLLELLRETALP
jgi:hypothetical protein